MKVASGRCAGYRIQETGCRIQGTGQLTSDSNRPPKRESGPLACEESGEKVHQSWHTHSLLGPNFLDN